jgi:hypothetical protein
VPHSNRGAEKLCNDTNRLETGFRADIFGKKVSFFCGCFADFGPIVALNSQSFVIIDNSFQTH